MILECMGTNCGAIYDFIDSDSLTIPEGWRITGVDEERELVALCPKCAPQLDALANFQKPVIYPLEPELNVIAACYDDIKKLEPDAQRRVLDWLISRIEYDQNKPLRPIPVGAPK